MTVSPKRSVFGVHNICVYNPTTGKPYGQGKVLGQVGFNLAGETVELRGGSLRFPWDVQDGNINAEVSLTLKEYPDWAFEVFTGKAPTATAASATGAVNNFANKKGSTIKDASNGISGIAITGSDNADLKFAKYVIVALSANTFDLYALSDVDFNRGTDALFIDDANKINSVALDISAASVVMADLGITFTKAGTPAFTVGDTATFEIIPVNTGGSMEVTIGGLSDVFPEVGILLMAQQKGNGEMFEIDIFRCKALGMPFNLQEKGFSEFNLTAKAFYDENRLGIAKFRTVRP